MRFYDREKELSKLSEIADLSSERSHLMVITGRRRIGKTELIRHFARNRSDILYFFVSKKKPHVLLEEFRDIISEKIPTARGVSFTNFEDFFSFIFSLMSEKSLIVVLDEFQNFESVDPSVFSIVQKHWDNEKDKIRGAFIFIGSVFTLMRKIFEGNKEPLFGRATSWLYVSPLDPDGVSEILSDHRIDAAAQLTFYYTLFGGIPKYYFLSDRYRLFGKPHSEIIRKLYCEPDAPLQNEGRELLIEEFGKNYHLYFSILQVIAAGVTQMARIADSSGINLSSISKYLDELTTYYRVLERRTPVTEFRQEAKIGRYYIEDPALRFWFRYIFKNQSLIEIGDEKGLTAKIAHDLPNLMGSSFEKLIRDILVRRNRGDILPFRFSRIGNFWTRKGETEIDIVAVDEDGGSILFGECKLKGKRFTVTEALRLREKAGYVRWMRDERKEYFALFSVNELPESHRRALESEGILHFSLGRLLLQKLKLPPQK